MQESDATQTEGDSVTAARPTTLKQLRDSGWQPRTADPVCVLRPERHHGGALQRISGLRDPAGGLVVGPRRGPTPDPDERGGRHRQEGSQISMFQVPVETGMPVKTGNNQAKLVITRAM